MFASLYKLPFFASWFWIVQHPWPFWFSMVLLPGLLGMSLLFYATYRKSALPSLSVGEEGALPWG